MLPRPHGFDRAAAADLLAWRGTGGSCSGPARPPTSAAEAPRTSPMAMARLEGYDRCGGEREQLVVQGEDLRPVGLLECRGVRMDGVDRGLELVCTRLI